MTEEELINIFEEDIPYNPAMQPVIDSIFEGLKILRKYMPNKTLIQGADHDVIYSVSVSDMVEAGITVADAKYLRLLNWVVCEGEYLAQHYA